MATLKQRLHRKTDSGSYDVVHLETSADIVSEGKKQVASAITDRGISTASDASFSTMAANIRKIDKTISGTPVLNKDFTYTGNCQVIDDSTQASNEWRIKCLTSGTLKFTAKVAVDIFFVGGGGGGVVGTTRSSTSIPGAGGGGGYTKTLKNITLAANTSYTITIGSGGVKSSSNSTAGATGGTTSISSISNGSVTGGIGGNPNSSTTGSSVGGNGGSGGGAGISAVGAMQSNLGTHVAAIRSSGGTNGGNGGKCEAYNTLSKKVTATSIDGTVGTGQGTTTREFGDGAGTLYSQGGYSGGYSYTYSDSTITGVKLIGPTTSANTGKGGDGGYGTSTTATYLPGAGSSGILIIRKHQT